jgi:hypothetical protein
MGEACYNERVGEGNFLVYLADCGPALAAAYPLYGHDAWQTGIDTGGVVVHVDSSIL